MSLSPAKRKIALGVALAATLGATVWVGEQDDAAPELVAQAAPRPAVEPASRPAPRASVPAITRAGLKREISREPVPDVFAAKSWYVPPPPPKYVPPPPPPPPPAPVPPPLPFGYLGKLVDHGEITVFVVFKGRNLAVKANEVIDSTYRIDSVDARSMVLTYLPLDMKQTLSLGERK